MRRRLATLAAAALTVALLVPVASVSAASVIYVRPGQSIQAAINKAPAGSLISVERGTYRGNLEIKRSLRLIGHDTVIVPAAKPTKNFCSTPGVVRGVTGVCVHAVFSADGQSIVTPVSKVSIQGFTIQNFSGPGIVALGVGGFRAAHNVTAHNETGILINSVSNLSLLYNTAYGNSAEGFLVLDSPAANAAIIGNRLYDNLSSGILFLDSLGGRIALNTVYGNCSGIAVVAAAESDVIPSSGDVSIQLNQVTANNRMCPDLTAEGGPPAYGGIGIGLLGARNTVVALNDVRGNVEQTGSGITGGGIVILDGAMFGAAPPTGNTVRLNWLSGNTPNDIYGDGTGSTNTISGNVCTTTNLTGAC